MVIWLIFPRIDPGPFRMADEIEDFDDAFPNRFPFECLFHRHTFTVRGLRTVQPMNLGKGGNGGDLFIGAEYVGT